MATEREPEVNLSRIVQACIVVKDLDNAVDYLRSILGWGPFKVAEFVNEGTYRGKLNSGRTRIALAQVGPIAIEVVEAVEGESPTVEFLRKNGEGLQHLGIRVDDIDAAVAQLHKGGVETVFRRQTKQGTSVAFVKTQIGEHMIELIQYK